MSPLPSQPPPLPTALPPIHHPPVGDTSGYGYQATGALTATQLLDGDPILAKLAPKIVEVRNWLQQHIQRQNLSEKVAAARQDSGLREEMVRDLDRELLKYMSKVDGVVGAQRNTLIAAVINEVLGLGPIEPLWGDPRITEVMVNGPEEVFVELEGRILPVPGAKFRSQEHLLEVCQQILMPLNRRVDQKAPLADGRLPDGSRVNIVHYTVAPHGPLLTIRRFPEKVWTLYDLVENGSVSEEMACELALLVTHKASAVIIGGTGGGKTTLLNALSSCIARDERLVTIEDSLELRLHPDAHVASLEARPASASGEGEVRIRDLVKNALRMRPDRIIVGEVRDASALDMLTAMNTGHEGSMTTVHANGADEAIQRLGTMIAMGGEIPDSKVSWLIGDAVDIMIVQRRYPDGHRRVAGVFEVPSMRDSADGTLQPIPLWEWAQTGVDADGVYVGEHRRVQDISRGLYALKGLDFAKKLTIEDVRHMSRLPDRM